MQMVSFADNLQELLSPILLGKKENINLSSAELILSSKTSRLDWILF